MLFDFGGTLVDCPAWMDLELRDLVPAALEVLAARGWEVPAGTDVSLGRKLLGELRAAARESWLECPARRCLEVILPRLGVPCPPAGVLDRVLEEIYAGLLPQVRWLPGSRELLDEIRRAGAGLGLVSNAAYGPFVREALERGGVDHLFGSVVVSAETGWRKPHPDPFLRALRELGAAARETVHVGDHFGQDVVGAGRLGIMPLWIAEGAAAAPPLPAGAVAPVVVPDLEEAAAYLTRRLARGGVPGEGGPA